MVREMEIRKWLPPKVTLGSTHPLAWVFFLGFLWYFTEFKINYLSFLREIEWFLIYNSIKWKRKFIAGDYLVNNWCKNQAYMTFQIPPSSKLHLFSQETFSIFPRILLKGSKSGSDFVDSKHRDLPLKERAWATFKLSHVGSRLLC